MTEAWHGQRHRVQLVRVPIAKRAQGREPGGMSLVMVRIRPEDPAPKSVRAVLRELAGRGVVRVTRNIADEQIFVVVGPASNVAELHRVLDALPGWPIEPAPAPHPPPPPKPTAPPRRPSPKLPPAGLRSLMSRSLAGLPGAETWTPPVREAVSAALAAGVKRSDVEWYLERLDDLTLLTWAVPLTSVGSSSWAVPVGGKRRSGCVDWALPGQGERIRKFLAGQEGFPDLRVGHDLEEGGGMVRWGLAEPRTPPWDAPDLEWARIPVIEGRLYGYSEQAIEAFVTAHWGAQLAAEAMRQP